MRVEELLVIDALEVGPPLVERARLRVPYLVRRSGREVRAELAFRYEEDVFTPGEPASESLAAMLGAQVALNYGLFCRELVFRGRFSVEDRRFIETYAAHTAREIYVNKLHADNPFLVGGARALDFELRESYLLCTLRFEDEAAGEEASWRALCPAPSREGIALLSSGGKESLLSQGLLDDAGYAVHPVFVNESGRHWYTALNAYRELKKSDPRCARVWTNADRLFTFMLRQLPFIRADFGRVRADVYPIRLWTVALFLFAALPLAAKRGLGRLVIGSEHDTSVVAEERGVPHFAGLFDQSRFFDAEMSRYLAARGLCVEVLSILRTCSELLVEKLLHERYPELLALQVSCHAAHEATGAMRPCGRCEKCRRVVSMLVAIDADPGVCGYEHGQVERILGELPDTALHQERACSEEVRRRLVARGLIPAGSEGQAHPEVLSLRFHPERSPLDELPEDLARRVLPLMLEHAEGALVWREGRWEPLAAHWSAPLGGEKARDEGIAEPLEAESGQAPGDEESRRPLAERHVWASLSWPEARERVRLSDVALLPVGAIEQHGPHLPLDVDAFDAERLALDVAAACAAPRPLVLPLLPYGVSYHHDDFPGTLSVSPETLARMVHEIGMSAARQGMRKLVIVNGHGGNAPALHFAAQTINRDARIFTCVDTGETSDHDIGELTLTPNDVHAGEVETSTTLHLRPAVVRREESKAFVPRFSSDYLDFSSKRSVGWYARTARISPSGVLGDPTKASAEKGARMWALMVDHLVALVEHLARMRLEEIHQRRY